MSNEKQNGNNAVAIKLSKTQLELIKAGQEAIEMLKEIKNYAPYCTEHREQIEGILAKVSVDTEVLQNEA